MKQIYAYFETKLANALVGYSYAGSTERVGREMTDQTNRHKNKAGPESSASEMTYIVSSGALNSTHSLRP